MFFRDKNLNKKFSKVTSDFLGWVNNFWIIDDHVYFTDSDFTNEKNSLSSLSIMEFEKLVKTKQNPSESRWFSNPYALNNFNPVDGYKSHLKLEKIFVDFLYNICFDRTESYIKIDDLTKGYNTSNNFDNYLCEAFPFFRSTISRQVSFYDQTNEILIPSYYDIKKVIKLDEKYIVATNDTIYQTNKLTCFDQYQQIYASSDELTICRFDNETIIVSDKATKLTFIMNIVDPSKTFEIYRNNYFYKIECCVDKQFLLMKPLFDNNTKIDYNLNVFIIY